MKEVPWLELGFEGKSLGFLLTQIGWFYSQYRAEADAAALLHLLAHRCHDGERVLAKLIAKAERRTVRIAPRQPDYALRFQLKARGYQWDAGRKSWWIEVEEAAVESE